MLLLSLLAPRKRPTSTLAMFRHLGALGLVSLAILDGTPLPTFGGPDILLVILVLTRRDPWYEYAAAATAGSIIGAYVTFRLARTAGKAYLESSFSQRKIAKLLKVFDHWGTGALAASSAVPFPTPTSVFFAAAGASHTYSSQKFLTVVGAARALRYSALAIVAKLYGRHFIRVLRHPTQYLGWFLLLAVVFVALVVSGIIVNRRMAEATP